MEQRMSTLTALFGWFMLILAILLGPLAKMLPINPNRPWVDGFLINTLRAYKKYDTQEWLRRMAVMRKHPEIVHQHLKILRNKQEVKSLGPAYALPDKLKLCHYVNTSHSYHRDRVRRLRNNLPITSAYGPIIVVNNVVHDGNHRVKAYLEAKHRAIPVQLWETK